MSEARGEAVSAPELDLDALEKRNAAWPLTRPETNALIARLRAAEAERDAKARFVEESVAACSEAGKLARDWEASSKAYAELKDTWQARAEAAEARVRELEAELHAAKEAQDHVGGRVAAVKLSRLEAENAALRAVVEAARELERANDAALGWERPRPDIAWRNLKAALAALEVGT